MSRIILASASPRRKELLEQIGVEFEICPAKGEENITKTDPKEVVEELSRQKAEEVASAVAAYNENHKELVTPEDILIIGADTVVCYGSKILGKPADTEESKKMLALLSGQTHSVYTGVTLVFLDKSGRTGEHGFVEKTDVSFYPMDEIEINRYADGGEGLDKAGSYGIQDSFAVYIRKIHGDYNNVVGLPLARLYQELKKIGADIRNFS